jgi:hypothetical protein
MGPKNVDDKIDIQNEVGREMEFGVKHPPTASTFLKKFED